MLQAILSPLGTWLQPHLSFPLPRICLTPFFFSAPPRRPSFADFSQLSPRLGRSCLASTFCWYRFLDQPIPPSKGMTGPTLATYQNYVEQGSREIGTLFSSEQWWRDHYNDVAECGYRLRQRYHPQWRPSWIRAGTDFFTMEDGQPCLVSAVL